MNLFKRAALIFVTVMVVSLGWTVQASLAAEADNLSLEQSIGTPSKKAKSGTGTTLNNMSLQASQYFMSGNSLIEVLTSTRLSVYANTKAFRPVDNISVDMYLEKWESSKSQWVTVLPIGTTTNYYSSIVSTTKEVSVLKDHYYRLRVNHRVIHAGVVEEKTSISTYVYPE